MDDLTVYLKKMQALYETDPTVAVRSQGFIQMLHQYIEDDMESRISPSGKNNGLRVVREAGIYGSYKKKNEDIAVIDPINGPLMTIGVRSQMSSVGKNALTYYQDIIGECIGLQQRFPMTTMGYVYLHPYRELIAERKVPDHQRWAKLYASIGERDNKLYRSQVGCYDQFAYLIVDFEADEPRVRDDIVRKAVPDLDMRVDTLCERMVNTFVARNMWLGNLFLATV